MELAKRMSTNHKILTQLIAVLMLSFSALVADNFQLFRISKFNGVIGLNTQYRYQETIFQNQKSEQIHAQILTGKLGANITSIVWHPNFLQFDLEGNYNPGTRRDLYLVAPDRSEISSLESIKGKATFFAQRPLRLVFFAGYSHTYVNRELTTDVETFRNTAGTNIGIRNRFMPINFQWVNESWRQFELATGRTFKSKIENMFVEVNKSFSKYDAGKIKFNRRDASYQYANGAQYQNLLQELHFNENIFFDKLRMSGLYSNVWATKQTGSQPFERLTVNENLNIQLPLSFRFNTGYRYNDNRYQFVRNVLHNFNTRLQHQLYKSLTSSLYYNFDDVKSTSYDEQRKIWGGGLRYTKKIPGGVLNLNYEVSRRQTQRKNESVVLHIFEEEHVLEDGKVILLQYPYVIKETIVVKDEQGIVIYQENIDYIVIERGDFIEIQRLPGGQIPPGATVLIDYTAQQTTDYDYTLKGKNYGVGLNLFKNFIRLYYRRNKNDFDELNPLLLRILKWTDQQVAGIELSYKMINLGFENDEYKTNIIPYRSKRYFLSLSGRSGKDVTYILSGNYRDYYLVDSDETQEFMDVTSRIIYQFLSKTRIEITGSYRKQVGRSLNLELFTGHGEWQTQFRSTWFKLGIEFYRRNYEGETTTFSNAYFRVERKF